MCNYTHGLRDEQIIYESLKLQFRGAEKQRPSTLDLSAALMIALQSKLRMRPKAAKRELLEEVIMEYNKQVPIKNWKLLGEQKAAIKNLVKAPEELRVIIRQHLNQYRHEVSAITVSVLADGIFVPGTSRLQQDAAGEWRSIMMVNEGAAIMWGQRLIKGFESRAPPSSSSKQKAGPSMF